MKEWQFNALFLVGLGGAVVLLFADPLGIEVRPEVVTVFGTILAFVLTQKLSNKKDNGDGPDNTKNAGPDEGGEVK